MSVSLESIPEPVMKSFSNIFDKAEKPNWRTLVSVLPDGFYSSQKIELFAMDILKPNGSPTYSLLQDLAKRKRTLLDLLGWLHCIKVKGFDVERATSILEQRGVPVSQPSTTSTITITSDPMSGSGLIGSMYKIQCTAHGDEPLHYQ